MTAKIAATSVAPNDKNVRATRTSVPERHEHLCYQTKSCGPSIHAQNDIHVAKENPCPDDKSIRAARTSCDDENICAARAFVWPEPSCPHTDEASMPER